MISLKKFLGTVGGFALGGPAGALAGYNIGAGLDAEDQQKDALNSANAQAASATAAQQQAQREAQAVALSGYQTSYDLSRAAQQQQMPWNMASLSALQVLPQLQQALGMPAYNVAKNIPGMPDVNFAQAFQAAMQGMNRQNPQSPSGVIWPTQQPAGTVDPGTRVNILPNPDGTVPDNQAAYNPPEGQPAAITEGQTLEAYDGPAYNVEASPLYEWQKKEATEALRNQLAAQGLGQSTYGQREETRIRQSLSAYERDRQINDMFRMLQFGFGAPAASQSGAANTATQAGSDVAQSLTNIGAIGAAGSLAQAQNNMAYANAAAQRPDPIMQGLQIYGMFNQFGNKGASNVTPYVPSTQVQLGTMPGMGIPIF